MAYTTKKSLLSKIKQGDEIAFIDFYKIYTPLILLRGSDYNLSATEKNDLIQDTVLSIFKGCKTFKYDKKKGRFRDFLRTIISRRACDIIKKRHSYEQLNDSIKEPLDDIELDKKWQNEWYEHILRQALFELKTTVEPETYQAFELFAIKNKTAKETASLLGVSENTVYLAKHRAMSKLKQIIKDIKNN